mmetsp:Transcript_21414/g.59450  ORF Transcript_21414/g.59450 Transcript_21414/m.59450 type:complete len:202 (-) Transcript_21414:2118-2723(-)
MLRARTAQRWSTWAASPCKSWSTFASLLFSSSASAAGCCPRSISHRRPRRRGSSATKSALRRRTPRTVACCALCRCGMTSCASKLQSSVPQRKGSGSRRPAPQTTRGQRPPPHGRRCNTAPPARASSWPLPPHPPPGRRQTSTWSQTCRLQSWTSCTTYSTRRTPCTAMTAARNRRWPSTWRTSRRSLSLWASSRRTWRRR